MAAPDERKFVVFPRGHIRDNIILLRMRIGMRAMVNPDTGITFTEDEITRALQPGSRFYIESDGIDLALQAGQSRALFFSDQVTPSRSNTSFLENQHGFLWLGENSRLPAVGGSGTVTATGTPGSVYIGSTTIGDPAVSVATDPNGTRYQVLVSAVIPASGSVVLQMQGIDTGLDTNPSPPTELTWSANQPLGTDPTAVVLTQFTGGFPIETDSDYAKRIEDQIRNRPAAGNNAHIQAWSRQATVAVEQAFVYATALNAGSVIVSPTQKRSLPGPNGRLPSVGTLAALTGYLVPPSSPVFPERAFVLVTTITPQPSDIQMRISMAQGTGGGWFDPIPWPVYSVFPTQINVVTDQLNFQMQALASSLPGGATTLSGDEAPNFMLWNKDGVGAADLGRWEQLDVISVTEAAPGLYDVVLNSAPSFIMKVLDVVSPFTDRLVVIAEAIEEYFDSIGPGELVDINNDVRGVRAARAPSPVDSFSTAAGQLLVSFVIDALGGVSPLAELTSISDTVPDLPTNIADGPNMITVGFASIYPLEI